MVTMGHLRVTIGHPRVTVGHPGVIFSFLFFTLCKHKANTTELHLKVRPTCQIVIFLFSIM